MREIKFRAWCPEHRSTNIMAPYEAHMTEVFGLFDAPNDLPEEVVIMQYTGLKDKNGKEIFEGDIVSSGDVVREVVYEHCGFSPKIGKGLWSSLNSYSWRVIGNIHENADLLNA